MRTVPKAFLEAELGKLLSELTQSLCHLLPQFASEEEK
jgi:hypothetical protein